MQVILLEKVVNLGQLGEVVKVRDGYARNYLIPQGKASRATEKAKKEFEARRAELEKAQSDRLATARTLADRLSGLTVQITERAGVDGRLFGSVTPASIAEALARDGFEVSRSMLRMPDGPIKAIGDYKVEVVPHVDVAAEINVSVLGDHA
ncbi:MAG: 50S ribosomal protein L9 [Burkholderiaceae bacterium]|nr:50S ribosomal protein L9 [Burkholderiaceae bacterium]MEB2320716.1 50S ribosomal protein L9 [Pseudomonadota bacterium]